MDASDTQFVQVLKAALLQLEQRFDAFLAKYDSGVAEESDDDTWSAYYADHEPDEDEAYWIALFIEDIALRAKQYELTGICLSVKGKATRVEEVKAEMAREREEKLRMQRDPRNQQLKATDLISASGIGELLEPRRSASQVNQLLESLGLLVCSNNGWVATEAAQPHADQRNLNYKPYVYWRASILGVLVEMQQPLHFKALA